LGAVIVDLSVSATKLRWSRCCKLTRSQGVRDSNAARAAVAEGYMKQCTGLWIVTPITRAVDDKAAKNLLGETFRRQLKFDGTYSAVTFICSKSDDISITEAIDSLELQGQMEEYDDEFVSRNREQREVKNKIKKLKVDKEDLTDASEEAEQNLEKWEALKDKVEDGESVYLPAASSNKRKHLAELDQNSSTSFDGSPLTIERIDHEINELRRV